MRLATVGLVAIIISPMTYADIVYTDGFILNWDSSSSNNPSILSPSPGGINTSTNFTNTSGTQSTLDVTTLAPYSMSTIGSDSPGVYTQHIDFTITAQNGYYLNSFNLSSGNGLMGGKIDAGSFTSSSTLSLNGGGSLANVRVINVASSVLYPSAPSWSPAIPYYDGVYQSFNYGLAVTQDGSFLTCTSSCVYNPSGLTSISFDATYTWTLNDAGGDNQAFFENLYPMAAQLSVVSSRVAPIPEPETYALIFLGLIGLMIHKRLQKFM